MQEKNRKTFVCADIGSNHNRDWRIALELIDSVKNSGANAAKFQTYSSETLYSKYTKDFAGYTNIPKLIKDIELPREWQKDLKKYCDDNDVEFISTPFDERAVDELYNLGVKRFKISGFEATDIRFIKYVASTNLPLIVSVGIGTNMFTIQFNIIYPILSINKKCDITLLHCNHAYPTPFEDINITRLYDIRKNIRGISCIGISDHTTGIIVPPIAVTHGALFIEKHLTLNRNQKGPDHSFAINPIELKEMVKNIEIAECCMGSKKEEVILTKSEEKYSNAMRSVVAKTNIKKSEFLTIHNVTTKRPYFHGAIHASKYYDILDKEVKNDILEDQIILESMIK